MATVAFAFPVAADSSSSELVAFSSLPSEVHPFWLQVQVHAIIPLLAVAPLIKFTYPWVIIVTIFPFVAKTTQEEVTQTPVFFP